MKAITCSQCGAVLTDFKKGDDSVSCEYCKAKIPIVKEKIIQVTAEEVEKQKLRKLSEKEKARVFTSVNYDYVPFIDEETKTAIFVIGTIVIAIALAVGISMLEPKQEKKQDHETNMETTIAPR